MKKIICLLILSVAFILKGCSNGPLEIEEIKHDGETFFTAFKVMHYGKSLLYG